MVGFVSLFVTLCLSGEKPLTGIYRTAYGQNLRRGLFISRADFAHLMLTVLEQPETIRQVIGSAY